MSAYTGTRSNIKCSYENEYKYHKMEPDKWALKQVSIVSNSVWSHDGRYSIHDDGSAGFFSVFTRELMTEDPGTYACAVVLSDETEIYTVVTLNVTEGE